MSVITSVHNEKVKWVRALQGSARQRRDEAVLVVEGVRLVEEALASGWEARLVLYDPELNARGLALVDGFAARGAPVEAALPAVLKAAGDTETPQGILVVLAQPRLPLPAAPTFVLIADALRDPGNLGTLIRTAAAAGVDALLCSPETVDAFAPKVLRAGMGAHFRLPIVSLDWEQIAAQVHGLTVYLAAAGEGPAYDQTDLTQPLALIVGSEAQGASPAARQLAGSLLHIPMPGGSESLNAAIAATVMIFEVVRQRRAAGVGPQ